MDGNTENRGLWVRKRAPVAVYLLQRNGTALATKHEQTTANYAGSAFHARD